MAFTLKSIANLSGVSITTVSRVLAGKPGVNKETRDKVISIAKSLDYKVNLNARSMKTNRTNTIGLVVADITNQFYSEIAKTIEIQARKLGFTVIVANTDNSAEQESQIINAFQNRKVDGFIFASCTINDKSVQQLINDGTPAILFHRHLNNGFKHHFIGGNDEEGVEKAVKHLYDLGHRRVAFISGSIEFSTGSERLRSFIRQRELLGLNMDPCLIKEGGYDSEKTKKAVKELFSMTDKPTAIFASNDFMALEVMSDVIELGYKVPEDISIIGFDNIPLASHKRINLTTMDIQITQGATLALMNLINMIDRISSSKDFINIRLETTLIQRGSTAPPRMS